MGGCQYTREEHIQKIAWFVCNDIIYPIEIDVGCPSFGVIPNWMIVDGNHRFAAKIIRKDRFVEASISGEVDLIKNLFGVSPCPE